jgi:hypothetical protein
VLLLPRWKNAAVLLHCAGDTNEGEVRVGAGEGNVRGDCLVVLVEEGLPSVKGEKLVGSEIKREQIKGNCVVN